MSPYRNTQQYVITSSPVVKTGTSQERKKNLTCPDATSNPKSFNKLGMASHPGSSLACYNCFYVLAAEVRSCHLGDCTHCFVLHQTCRRSPILGSRDATVFLWFFSPYHKDRFLFFLILKSSFQDVQGKQLQNHSDRRSGNRQHAARKWGGKRRNASSLWSLGSAEQQVKTQPKPPLQVEGCSCTFWGGTDKEFGLTSAAVIPLRSPGMLNLLPVSTASSRPEGLTQNWWDITTAATHSSATFPLLFWSAAIPHCHPVLL